MNIFLSKIARRSEIQDAYIAVMGVTGAGESSLIATCSGEEVKIGHGLQSCKSHLPYPP